MKTKIVTLILSVIWFSGLSQKMDINILVDTIFCKGGFIFNYSELYTKEITDSILSTNKSRKVPCLKVITYYDEKEFLKKLKCNKNIYVFTYSKKFVNTENNFITYTLSINEAVYKSYKKQNVMILHDVYEVTIKKNSDNTKWEIVQIKYPARAESLRKNK